MQTKVSTKGQVVLPGPVRRKLGIEPGDPLEVKVENGHILLTPRKKQVRSGVIVVDPLTGLPALSAGPQAPTLTSKEVAEILANFP